MTNFLPLIAMLLMSAKGKESGFSLQSIAPLMSAFGLSPDMFSKGAGGLPMGDILSGNFSAEKLLPLLINMMNSPQKSQFNSVTSFEKGDIPPKTHKNSADGMPAPNYLKPITSIAGEDVNYALSHYFSNN